MLSCFIDVASRLMDVNNFFGAMEVTSGLRSLPVSRLRKTWAALSSKRLMQCSVVFL